MTAAGFPHSDTLGSQLVCQLPEAYRRLQRPSSAPSAKAFTVCPYKLHALQLITSQKPGHHHHTHKAHTPKGMNDRGPWNGAWNTYIKMLASTVQFSNNRRTHPHRTPTPTTRTRPTPHTPAQPETTQGRTRIRRSRRYAPSR